jgi:hypothetical protein
MEMSSYTLSPLRTGDLALYRATGHGVGPTFFVVAQTVSAVWLRRLEQEYALREELDAAWSARPLELHRQDGRWILVLEDPGGEPLWHSMFFCGSRLESRQQCGACMKGILFIKI